MLSFPEKLSVKGLILPAFWVSMIGAAVSILIFPNPSVGPSFYNPLSLYGDYYGRYDLLRIFHLIPQVPYELLIRLPTLLILPVCIFWLWHKYKESSPIDKTVYSIIFIICTIAILEGWFILWSIFTQY